MKAKTFTVLRRDKAGYSTRGPVAQPMTLKEARDEIIRLKTTFPFQDFVLVGEVGSVTRSESIFVKIEAPIIVKARKPPAKFAVVPLIRDTK